jgi:hypothetical protein
MNINVGDLIVLVDSKYTWKSEEVGKVGMVVSLNRKTFLYVFLNYMALENGRVKLF